MDLGSNIVKLRKEKGLSREELGDEVGTSGAIIGRYERNEITPSVEVALNIANALGVSLDFLVGSASATVKDKKMVYRLELLEKISKEDKETILKVMDSLLKDAQMAHTHKKLK